MFSVNLYFLYMNKQALTIKIVIQQEFKRQIKTWLGKNMNLKTKFHNHKNKILHPGMTP